MSAMQFGRALLTACRAGVHLRLPLSRQPRRAASQLPVGNSQELGFYYRHPGSISRQQSLMMESFGALVWFYILYNTYHYPAMVFGHPSYPNPRKWTDAELGVPPA